MRKIVVGVDGSAEAAAALSWAYDEAALHGAELYVIHAWTYPWLGPRTNVAEPRDDLELEAAKLLQREVQGIVEAKGGSVKLHPQLSERPPAEALIAEGKDADLLVVGSRGRGGFAALLLGSVSHQVAQHAPCPVAVIRAPEA